jgi:predicted AAA+ superfamily ATPase
LAVIGAGSLLETLFTGNQPFPVGRVEYKMVRPLCFSEFLLALGEKAASEVFHTMPLPAHGESTLFRLFHLYALIGGMPEVVQRYAQTRDLMALRPVYDGLLLGYHDDVEKYGSGKSQIEHIRFVLKSMYSLAGSRIKFEGFGNGPYKSREVGEALRLLEKAFLLQLIFPCTEARVPLAPDYKKSPKLQLSDTGLMCYVNGYQQDLLGTRDLSHHFRGLVIEHLTGQELLATDDSPRNMLHFWVRDKAGSSAEVDYLVNWKGTIVPIEIKSGPTGHLKSLLQVMEQFQLPFAIRFYAGSLACTEEKTPGGKVFKLLHLPYFLVSKWEEYAEWAFSQSEKP